MDTAGALFNSRFDDKNLRNELLNKKEERDGKVIGKVKRYRPGVVPDFAKQKEEKEQERKNAGGSETESVRFEKKKDPRLERLEAAQTTRRRPSRRVHAEAELIIDEEEEEPKEEPLDIQVPGQKQTEEDSVERRRLLLSRALDEEKEEMEVQEEEEEIVTPQKNLQSDEEYEYDEYDNDSEDEGTLFALRHRPTFIPKANRKTIEAPEEKERKERELEELETLKYEQRVKETQKMIENVRIHEIEEEENWGKKKDPRTAEEIPDDTDNLEDPEERNAWRWREFNRILRDRQREEEHQQDEAEKERRGKMTDAELEEENKRLEEEGIRKKKQEHVQGTFLQKYYHKGIFYLDDESIQSPDDIRNRDFHAPTERDMVNKLAMPKVMQVRDFGKKSQSKWTYLRNEDTTKTKDWLNELQTKNAESKFKHAGNK